MSVQISNIDICNNLSLSLFYLLLFFSYENDQQANSRECDGRGKKLKKKKKKSHQAKRLGDNNTKKPKAPLKQLKNITHIQSKSPYKSEIEIIGNKLCITMRKSSQASIIEPEFLRELYCDELCITSKCHHCGRSSNFQVSDRITNCCNYTHALQWKLILLFKEIKYNSRKQWFY